MSLPFNFATESGNQPAAQLDTNFVAVGNMGIYRCTATGSNVLTLTPNPNQPEVTAYADDMAFFFIAAATSTGTIQAQVGVLPDLPVYDQDGSATGANSITVAGAYIAFYQSSLNGGTGGFQLVQTPPSSQLSLVSNSITGFVPSSIAGTSTTATLSVSAGQATDSTNMVYINEASALPWAVANGNVINGFQGGTTLPNSSNIHFFIVTGTAGTGLFASTSITPTLPTGYTLYRRIFSLRTSGTGVLTAGTAFEINGGGLKFVLATSTADINVTSSTTAVIAPLPSVPGDVRMEACGLAGNITSTSSFTLFSSLDAADVAPTVAAAAPYYTASANANVASGTNYVQITTDGNAATAGRIRYRSSAAVPILFITQNYVDYRRS